MISFGSAFFYYKQCVSRICWFHTSRRDTKHCKAKNIRWLSRLGKNTIHRITIAAAMTRTESVFMTPQIIFLIIICFHPLSDLIYHARHCQHLQYQLKYLQLLYDLEVHLQYSETVSLPLLFQVLSPCQCGLFLPARVLV